MSPERFKPATDEEIARRRFGALYQAMELDPPCRECGGETEIAGALLCDSCRAREAWGCRVEGTATEHLRRRGATYTLCGLPVGRRTGPPGEKCSSCRRAARDLILPAAWGRG